MGIGVLGPLTLNGSVRIAPRDRVVLQALAVRVGEYVDSDVLADALWGEQPPASWPKIVQGCVSRLRKALGPDLIETSPYGYRLVVDPDGLDAATFERLLTNARNHLEAGDADRAAYVIGEGLSLWRGRAFPDLEEWEPGRAEIARLQGLRMDAQELAVSADIERGRSGAVLEEARRLVSAAPYREQRWALCARALYQSGRQAEALEVLHRARQRLREELGLDPGPALVQLEESILRQDPALAPTDAVDTSSVCPYRGLLAYEPQDSEAFFGREAEIGACLERLREAGVLAVVGPSGSGKSSLVRAGVVAALQRAGQSVVITTPGSRPLDSLGGVPRRGHPVLVVDQAEEALTLCPDPIERVRYFESLAAHEGPVVIALRADRLGDLPEYRDFARLVERGLYLLGGLGEQSMREAIEGPATQAGLRLEGGLCDLLVREVEGEPGALPLLSHVLRMTWGRREGSTLTVAGYHATGGVRHAVAQSAESLYDGLDDAGREHLRALCLRLVLPADDGDPVRARVPRRKVVLDRAHEKLVESLVAARLVTSDEGDLQIAHESLAREWPRLRSWLEEDVEGQRIFGHLASAAEWWEAKGRPDSELYRGVRLAGAADWAGRGSAELTEVERDFLDASVELEERENRAAHQQLAQQRRANRRLRELLVGVAALLVVALVASFLAARQTSRARDEASSARAATRSADAHRVGLLSADDKDLPRSLLLALEANRLHDDPETRDRLSAALTREPRLVRTLALEDLEGVALSPDGSRALAVGPGDDHGALMVEVASGATVAHNEDSFSQVSWLDRSTVAVGRDYGPGLPAKPEALVLLDAATLAPLAHQLRGQPAHTSLNGGLAASADGRYVAGVFDHVQSDGTIDRNQVLAWDRRRPDRPMFRLTLYNAQIGGIDNRGHVFVGTGGRRTITSYDGATGRREVSRTVAGRGSITISSGALAPDQHQLAVTVDDDVVLLDAHTLRETRRWHDDDGTPNQPAFSRDSRLLATGTDGAEGGVTVWDSASGRRVASVARFGQDDHPREAFSPGGRSVMTAGAHGLYLWDLAGEHGILRTLPAAHLGRSVGLTVISPDGSRVAYVDSQGAAPDHFLTQVQDVATGRIVASFQSRKDPGVNDLQWFPDSNRIAVTEGAAVFVHDVAENSGMTTPDLGLGHLNTVGSWGSARGLYALASDGTLAVLDPTTLRVERTFRGFDGNTTPATSRTGSMVLSAGKQRATVLDLDSGHRRTFHLGSDQFPWALAMSPDGHRFVAAIGDVGEGLYDVSDQRWISPPTQEYGAVQYAADGQRYLSAGSSSLTLRDGRTGGYVGSVQLDTAYPAARFSPRKGTS